LTLRAKVGGCCHCYCYYPHILPVKQPPVLQLLSRPYWGLSPRRRDIIHGLAWNLARRRGPNGTNVPNFTLMRQYLRVSGPRSPRMAKLSTFSAILRCVALQGELIHGLAWNLARRPCQRAKLHANAWIFGGRPPPQKKNGKLPKLATFSPRRRTPCPMLVKSIVFMRAILLQKLLTFGALQLVN